MLSFMDCTLCSTGLGRWLLAELSETGYSREVASGIRREEALLQVHCFIGTSGG